MSPCQDDAVSVAQALGTSGDIAFDEFGSITLVPNQTSQQVTFRYQKATAAYVFEYLYIGSSGDVNPADIRAVVSAQDMNGFTVEFSGSPITFNCTLYWRVKVPDALSVCQTGSSQPQYAVVPFTQEGQTTMLKLEYQQSIVFPKAMKDENWFFEAFQIEYQGADLHPILRLFCLPTISQKTANGCTLDFNGTAQEDNYVMKWKVSDALP